MVNNPALRRLVVGQYDLSKATADGRQRVRNGPIFNLVAVKKLVRDNGVHVLNPNADATMSQDFSPELLTEEIEDIIVNGLRFDDAKSHYVESEICKANGMPVDCDAYSIKWNRRKRTESNYSQAIYLKFGFKDNRPLCLIVRVHPSKY